jgi:hypothetical protein
VFTPQTVEHAVHDQSGTGAPGEKRHTVDRIEPVRAAAEFATRPRPAELLDHRVDLVPPSPQHVLDAFARTGAENTGVDSNIRTSSSLNSRRSSFGSSSSASSA